MFFILGECEKQPKSPPKSLFCALMLAFWGASLFSGCSGAGSAAIDGSASLAELSEDRKPLPRWILSQSEAAALFGGGTAVLSRGTYVIPTDFTLDLGTKNLKIVGVPGKTVITSYDGTAATDFSPKPMDTTIPDQYADGLYVVTKHPSYSYGGGFAHIDLGVSHATGGAKVWYTQGTILKKVNGVWSRHYTGAGFITKGNVSIQGVTFDNCQFYLFSPFGLTKTDRFEIINSRFNNVSRVLSSIMYGGIDQKPDWYNALQVYSVWGVYRFARFDILDSTFENIHTSIVWGVPPSEIINIKGNYISNSHAITFFTLFMKNYGDPYSFNNHSIQTITGNTFVNITQNNNWTTSLIRTSGIAEVSDNNFIGVTPQVLFIGGGNTSFKRNVIYKPNAATDLSAVVLVKSYSSDPNFPPVHTYSDNNVYSPNSFLVAVEGPSSHIIQDNIVNVKTVFSKNDSFQGNGQFLEITGNNITAPNMTNVAARDTVTTFQYVHVKNNFLKGLYYLHTGNTPMSEYVYTGNVLNASAATPYVSTAAINLNSAANSTRTCPVVPSCAPPVSGCGLVALVDAQGCFAGCRQVCVD